MGAKWIEDGEAEAFGLGALRPAFDRATRLAKTLFDAYDASIVLIRGDRVWRSRDDKRLARRRAHMAEAVIARGEPLWIEDLSKEKGPINPKRGLGLRFFAGAPIQLADSDVQGVLCVVAKTPRAHDRRLLARLKDIADGVADDCDRLRAIRAEAQSAAEARAASSVMSAFIQTLPMGIVMTDRDMRVLKTSPIWAAFFGLEESQAIGRTIYEISPSFEPYRWMHQQVLAGEKHVIPKLQITYRGRTGWLHTQLMPWREADGEIGGMMVTTHNITDLVEALDRVERSERRLKLAMQIADLNIWELDHERGTLDYEGDYTSVLGEPPTYERVKNEPYYFVLPEDRPRVIERAARRIAGERFEADDTFEARINRPDGKEVWASMAVEPVADENGELVRAVGVFQNITKRKKAELALQEALELAQRREAEARMANDVLSAFVDSIPIAVVMTDKESRVLRASPRWAQHFGYEAEDVVGRTIYEISPRMEKYRASHERCLAGERIRNPRLRIDRPEGAMWLETDLIPWRDQTGGIGGMLLCVHNVTNMVEAIESVERSEQRLRMAIQLADLHVWEVDFRRKVLEKAGEDSFFEKPLTYEDIVADFFCAVHPEDRERARQGLEKRKQGNVDERLVVRANRSDGKEVWMSTAAEIVAGKDGEPERVIGVFQNITSEKQAERALVEAKNAAEAANRSKSEFLANMSHEIRTPLNGVLGMTQVIEGDELSEVQRERVRVVRESGTALLAILNDLLDLSKIQAGKLELNPTDFDMAELAPVVAAAFEGTAAGKDIGLDLEVEASAEGAWVGDVLRLRQVLSNLLSNALKFTSQGKVGLKVSHDGTDLRFAVTDTGIGIDPENIPRLFEKFAQEDASTTRRYGGTGLGLAICRELVDLMGGRIEVESEKGVGSTFTVCVPLPRGQARAVSANSAAEPGAAAIAERPLRILAAEDNPTNQLVLRSLLAPLGVELSVVGDGRSAVEAYRMGRFDLVLMDVQMPEMNGVEATEAIRALEAEEGRARTPVLALSANVMTHQIEEYAEAGMDGCIAKPIEVEKLYAALETALTAPEPGKTARTSAA